MLENPNYNTAVLSEIKYFYQYFKLYQWKLRKIINHYIIKLLSITWTLINYIFKITEWSQKQNVLLNFIKE